MANALAIAASKSADERYPYPVRVRTIEAIRLANYRRIVDALRKDDEEIKNPAIAGALGLSSVYVWQIENGRRSVIESKAARLIERRMQKPEGWMDTDHDLWPFDSATLDAIRSLQPHDRYEIQGVLKSELARRGVGLVTSDHTPATSEQESSSSSGKKEVLGRFPGEVLRTGRAKGKSNAVDQFGAVPKKRNRGNA